MADFCMQCWPHVWGDPKEIGQPEGFNDFMADPEYILSNEESSISVVCEGCGLTYINAAGKCLGPCTRKHELVQRV